MGLERAFKITRSLCRVQTRSAALVPMAEKGAHWHTLAYCLLSVAVPVISSVLGSKPVIRSVSETAELRHVTQKCVCSSSVFSLHSNLSPPFVCRALEAFI